jgi:hypothetical protein
VVFSGEDRGLFVGRLIEEYLLFVDEAYRTDLLECLLEGTFALTDSVIFIKCLLGNSKILSSKLSAGHTGVMA